MENQFLPADPISTGIIVAIVVILGIILLGAAHINFHTFRFLKKEFQFLQNIPYESTLYRHIEQDFNRIKGKTENDINIQTLIEEYISGFKHKKNFLKMVQDIKLIQTLGSISILVGVLGTFIGLVFSISSIDETLSDISGVLDGIHTAFYTSIAGILVSIVINVMTKAWNSEHLLLQLMLKIENILILKDRKTLDLRLVDSMQDVKISVEKMTEAFLSVENFSRGFEKATKNLNSFNDMFSQNTKKLSRLFGDMEEFTETFNLRMESLNHKFQSLLGFLEKQEEVQAYSVDQMEKMSSGLTRFMAEQNDTQKANQQILSGVSESIHTTKDEIKEYLTSNLDRLHNAFEAMTDFYQETLDRQEQLVKSQEIIEVKNTAFIENIHQATMTMKDILETSSFEHIAEITSQFNHNITKMQKQFASLIHYFENIDETQQGYKELYEKVVGYIESQDKNQSQQWTLLMEYGKQNREMVDLFTKTQEYHGSFEENAKLLSGDMRRMIEQSGLIFAESNDRMKEQLANLHGALNEFVTLSNASMKDLILKLDDSLGENLQKSLRTFETYVKTTNQIIDKKFQTIVENSYIQNETSSYSMQMLHHSMNTLNESLTEVSTELKKKLPELVES